MKEFKPLTITIKTEQDLQMFGRILDWAARHAGVDGATPVSVFLQKLEAARIAAEREETPDLKVVA